uniref:NADH-ubiquinone oxidoreductase chain 4 n=1 Tax=Bisetocreagris titanium TaxID=2836860 RepID=A0A8F7KM52_9ARAC|nr:NADH dehydrogenase subunit 4 [Bisetocreagris titanium]
MMKLGVLFLILLMNTGLEQFLIMILIMNFMVILLNYSFNLIYMGFLVDEFSVILMLLTLWLSFMILIMVFNFKFMSKFFYEKLVFFMAIILVMSFVLKNLIFFYITFELILLPVTIMITHWGLNPYRLQAGIYMLFYTVSVSLPMILSMFLIYFNCGTLIMILISYLKIEFNLISLFLIMGMSVKFPIYILHLWLPKAHVQAPVFGSMILAGILLKLGGYGFLRILPMILFFNSVFLILMTIWGGFLTAFLSFRQTDLKMLVAYSSIGHMAMVYVNLIMFSSFSFKGSLSMMLAHGLCSSGMFFMVDVVYSRMHSRCLVLISGMFLVIPSLSLCWFLLSICNMAAPPSFSLYAEIILLTCGVWHSKWTIMVMVLLSFWGAIFSLYLFLYSNHSYSSSTISICGVTKMEYLILILHWIPLNLVILNTMMI